jgi:hypothetical protein
MADTNGRRTEKHGLYLNGQLIFLMYTLNHCLSLRYLRALLETFFSLAPSESDAMHDLGGL